ncbi:MAG: hypothetical protein GQ574_06395 [Crocinitomix sp.]|nr:hypothetical protein [Crocinitomix sp.]
MVNPILIPETIKNQKVLIAALDWGMGHTTRCVSVIRTLIKANNEVVFAGNEQQLNFIKIDFPGIKTETLQGYDIQLDSTKSTYLQMARQQKRIMKAIKKENSWLKKYVETNKVDYVISDNRYGFYHADIPSVIITHQLNLQVPTFKMITNWIIKRLIEKYDCCWVPDDEKRTLTGELSNAEIKIPVHFIGLLNRFEKIEVQHKYDFLVILSGPEPERTNFLNDCKNKAADLGSNIAFVGAKVDQYDSFVNPTTAELSLLIAQSNCVYSRAGYTTIMEMVGLNKKAILIPTKGQYEQEYLATYIQHSQLKFSITVGRN